MWNCGLPILTLNICSLRRGDIYTLQPQRGYGDGSKLTACTMPAMAPAMLQLALCCAALCAVPYASVLCGCCHAMHTLLLLCCCAYAATLLCLHA